MNQRRLMLAIPLALLALATSASGEPAPPADDAIIRDLVAKADALRDYHFRVEWYNPAGFRVYTGECWYAAPEQVRAIVRKCGDEGASRDRLVSGEHYYFSDSVTYESRAWSASDSLAARWRWGWEGGGLVPVYLTPAYLRWWPTVRPRGSEVVRGRRCRVLELGREGPRHTGRLEVIEADFMAFIPRAYSSVAARLWVDAETGMVRRWQSGGTYSRTRRSEVVETQQVNGFTLPSIIETTNSGAYSGTAHIVDVTVNQGIPEEVFEFRPLPKVLVYDRTLSMDEVRERLNAAPEDAALHYTLGEIHGRYQHWDDAAAEFRRAAELAPDSPSPLLELASTLRRGGNRDRQAGLDALRSGLALRGEAPWSARQWLADSCLDAGSITEGLREYRRIVAGTGPPMSYDVASDLAWRLARLDDFEAAYAALAEVQVTWLPTYRWWLAGTRNAVAWAQRANRLDDLRARVEDALAARPESNEMRLLLAKVLLVEGRAQDALRELKAVGPLGELTSDALEQVISLADDLDEDALSLQARGIWLEQAIESGDAPDIGRAVRPAEQEQRGPDLFIDCLGQLAAKYQAAADADSRADLLELARRLSDRAFASAIRQALIARDPDQMTPAECAVQGAVELARVRPYSQDDWPRPHVAACLERTATAWPGDAVLWKKLGQLRWWDQDWSAAAEAYGKAAAADPDDIESSAWLAYSQARLGQCAQALATARRAVEPWPEEPTPKAFLAAVQMACGQAEQAREALVAVLASSETSNRRAVADLLVRSYENEGQIDEAAAVLKREVAESPEWNRANAARALWYFYIRHRRHADAYAAARMSHSASSYRSEAINMARSLANQDREVFLAAVKADLDAHPGEAEAVRFAAIVCRQTHSWDMLPMLRAAVEKVDDASVWGEVANAVELTANPAMLADLLRRAVELDPDNAGLRGRYARVAADQGDRDPARALADELAAEAGDLDYRWLEVTELYLAAQAWDQAIAAAERLVALVHPTDETGQMRAQILAARAYAGNRDDHEARRRLIPILARADDRTLLREAADALVDLYLLRGERGQAIATLNDLRLRTRDYQLRTWIDARLKEITAPEDEVRQ